MPFTLPQSWPFCWWIAVVIDHFSRAVIGFAVFAKRPTSAEMQRFLDRAALRARDPPRYVITDKGRQFWCQSFRRWCRRRGIRPRFGAAGKRGSIAVVERFIRSLKDEHTRLILVPLTLGAMRREISLYTAWYNEHRPHMALVGRTPSEVYIGTRPANAKPRFEPRPNWPSRSPCASPQTSIKATCSTQLQLVVGYLGGRKHLPVVELRQAA
jgi:putative transposase